MGIVYKAIDTRLDRPVAIKAIADRHLLDIQAIDRLRREARAAAQLDHPHVCRVYELIESNTDVYIVMEFVEGETLRDRLRRGAMSYGDAMRYAVELAEGIADVHARGFVHRDVKPGNVMITPHGHVKILDFGLARRDMSSTPDASTVEAARTLIGAGTPQYMAPEQASGRPVTARADVYAIGVVLFECLTGKRPFDDGVTIAAALDRVAPLEIATLVARCLEPNPAARFEHAGVVALELRRLQRSPGRLRRLAVATMPWWRRRLAIIAMSATAIAIVAVVWNMNRAPPAAATFNLDRFDADPSRDFDSRISPDGKLVSFISTRLGRKQLFVKEVAGGNTIHVNTGVSEEVLTHVWSPDGAECAAVVQFPGSNRGFVQIFRATFGGSPRLTIELGPELGFLRAERWTNNTIYLKAEDQRSGVVERVQLLAVPVVAGAAPVNISASWKLPGSLVDLDVNPSGDRVVLILRLADQEDLFVMGLGEGAVPLRLTNDAFVERHPIWSGSNSVVFQSNRNGQPDLWETDVSSKTTTPVLTGPEEETAESAAADGSVITLTQYSVSADLWAITAPGESSRELTAGAIGSFSPSISANGRVLAVQRLQSIADRASPFTNSVVEAGPIVPSGLLAMAHVDAGALPMLSPDGSLVAYLQQPTRKTFQLVVRSVSSPRPQIVSGTPRLPSYAPSRLDWGGRPFNWSPDGRRLYYAQSNGELRVFAVGTGPIAEPLGKIQGEWLQDPVASPEGRSLAFLSTNDKVFKLHVLDLASRDDIVIASGDGGKSAIYNRGWTRDGRSLVLIRLATPRDEEQTVTAEIILADRQGSRVVASVPKVFFATAFLDAFRGAVYFAQAGVTGHRVIAVSLSTGLVTPLKESSNPRITFSGFATANGGPIIGVQDERRTDVWLARRQHR